MTAVVRLLVLAVLGLMLLLGCGNDGRNTAADSPSPPVATSRAVPESTSPTDPPAEDPVSITLYDADFTVHASGDLAVVETLTLDVPVHDRHGIYRTFDPDFAVEDFTATLDGSPTPINDTAENGEKVFRIGDPELTLDVGEHSVRMEYRVADVLTRDGAGGKQLDWLLIPDEWTMGILATELNVDLPGDATETHCTIGNVQPCNVSGVGTRTLVVKTRELADHTAVRLQVLMSRP